MIISSTMGSVGILHKLTVLNEGGYSRVLTTYNGQSKSRWKYQYYNLYWLSSDHYNGITENYIIQITILLHKYFVTVSYPFLSLNIAFVIYVITSIC